jgi:hypothetical protein
VGLCDNRRVHLQLSPRQPGEDQQRPRNFWRVWLRASLVLGLVQLLSAVLDFTVPFYEYGALGQHVRDIANMSLFFVGRLILTTLFGMQIEGPSLAYYSAGTGPHVAIFFGSSHTDRFLFRTTPSNRDA